MVVPTGVVVCGRADGPDRPIERFRFESLNRRIRDDPPYRWTGLSVERRRSRRDRSRGCGTQTRPRVQCLWFFRVIILQGLDVESVSKDGLDAL